jgi:hypothetical protein
MYLGVLPRTDNISEALPEDLRTGKCETAGNFVVAFMSRAYAEAFAKLNSQIPGASIWIGSYKELNNRGLLFPYQYGSGATPAVPRIKGGGNPDGP